MTSESLARQHERWQDHADGFQAGWHAALQRVSEGDSVTKLRDSVPDSAPAYRAERDRLAAEVERLRVALAEAPTPAPRGGVMVKAGDVYEVKPFPFVRHVATILGEDGPEDIDCWKPGTRFEARQRYLGHGEYDETVDCIADGEGVLRMTVIGVYTPPGYPQRIFYRRQWIDPDGKVFGARKLMVCVTSAFYRRARGYMHDYMVNGSAREGSGSRCWPKPTPIRVTPAREEGQ